MDYNIVKFSAKAGLLIFASFILTLKDKSNAAHATCIIIYIGKREILIGTDSRNVKKVYNSDSLQYLESCKIKKVGNLFFAMSGFTNSSSYSFNPYQIAEKLFSSTESLDSKITNLKIKIRNQLSEVLEKVKPDPQSWQMIVTKENRILDIAIIGKLNGRFGVYRLGFVLTNKKNITVDVQVEMISCTASTDQFIGFGDSEESKKYVNSHLKIESPEKIIVNAIKAQTIATPITVSEPINLLRVKEDSFDWIMNNSCNQ